MEKRHSQSNKVLRSANLHESKATEGEYPAQDMETEDEFDANEFEGRCRKEAEDDKFYEELLTTDEDSF